jgi:glycosyltransferase involved in cell wall biosynthesis
MANRLYILHKLPTPYNDCFFRALHADPDIELKVFHLWRGSQRRPWRTALGTGYPNYYLRPRLGIDWHCLRLALFDRDSLFMVGDWAHPPAIALLLARIIRRSPVALWVDTPQEHLKRPIWKRVPRRIFLRWLLRNVDVIFASGRPARRTLTAMGAAPERIVDLQFSVDLERPLQAPQQNEFQQRVQVMRSSVGCSPVGVVFGMSGTIDLPKKAQDVGLRAFAECRKRTSVPLGLLIAGDGPGLPHLRLLAEEMKVTQCVRFLGWQEPQDMEVFYSAIDVLLHPANFDPFPLVVVEAMAWSKPVIGTITSGSVEEKVQDGVNGFAVPPGNVDRMAAAMLRFVDDADLLRSASRAARQTVEAWPLERLVNVVKTTLCRLLVREGT